MDLLWPTETEARANLNRKTKSIHFSVLNWLIQELTTYSLLCLSVRVGFSLWHVDLTASLTHSWGGGKLVLSYEQIVLCMTNVIIWAATWPIAWQPEIELWANLNRTAINTLDWLKNVIRHTPIYISKQIESTKTGIFAFLLDGFRHNSASVRSHK